MDNSLDLEFDHLALCKMTAIEVFKILNLNIN